MSHLPEPALPSQRDRPRPPTATMDVLEEVGEERVQQDLKWGEQNYRDGTDKMYADSADFYRRLADSAKESTGDLALTWRHVLLEETYEALAETDLAKLRAELIQVAAVAVCWIEAIDRRTA